MKISPRLTFLSVFVVIFGAMNHFVLSTIYQDLNLQYDNIFYILLLTGTLSYVLAHTIEAAYPCFITRKIYYIAASLMGVIFISFAITVFYRILKVIFPLPNKPIILLSIIGLISLFALIKGAILTTKKIDIPIKGLKKDLTAVHLSDVHIGSIRGENFLKKIVGITNKAKPDIVFITGDLFDGTAPLTKDMLKPLDEINAPVFFSVGNHEQYEGLDEVFGILGQTKINILNNKIKECKGLQIIGIDFSESKKSLESNLKKIKYDKAKPTVLLLHGPDSFEYAAKNGIDLMLSGHTHGGQIYPFNLLVRLRYDKVKGLFKHNNSHLFVSTGTGTWGPPMRLGTSSEIVIIKLKNF